MSREVSASANGSGFKTIPSPPPKGRSSTVRWRSWVKARRLCTSTVTSPSASARRRIPFSKMLVKNSGKMVMISNFILFDDIGRNIRARSAPDMFYCWRTVMADFESHLTRWQSAGLLDAEMARRIRAYEAEQKKPTGQRLKSVGWQVIVVLILEIGR